MVSGTEACRQSSIEGHMHASDTKDSLTSITQNGISPDDGQLHVFQ